MLFKAPSVQLKCRIEVCTIYIFSLILYWLLVLPLCEGRLKTLKGLLFSLLWEVCMSMFPSDFYTQHLYHGWLGMPTLVSHWHALRPLLLYCTLTEDPLWARSVRAAFPSLTIILFQPRVKCRHEPQCRNLLSPSVKSYVLLCSPMTFHSLGSQCIRD